MCDIFKKLEEKANKLKTNTDKIMAEKNQLIKNIESNNKKDYMNNILDNFGNRSSTLIL